MQRRTLIDFFESVARLKETYIVHDDGYRTRRFTYSEIGRAARCFAAKLEAEGLQKGDMALLWSENRPEWIAALWGCMLRGVVAVPIDYRASWDLLRRVQAASGARVVLTGEEVHTEDAVGLRIWPLAEFDWSCRAPAASPADIEPQDVAEVLFTSGATAEPKGVVIRHSNILANIVPVEQEVLKHRRWGKPFFPLRFLNLLPLSHMFGQSMAAFIPPMLPGEVVFMNGYNPGEIARQIRSRRISVLVCVPKIMEVLRDYVHANFPESREQPPAGTHWIARWWKYRRIHRLFGWKFWAFVTGAAALPSEVEAFWSGMGYVVIQGYGLTETAPVVTLNHPFHTRKGSAGKPIAGVEVKTAADGEILVRGGNVTTGYLDQGPAVDAEGWLHTGDIGEIDESGNVFIRGRKKEMIVTSDGMNVFPEDVEQVLNSINGVRESAAVGTDRVHAVLVLDPGARPPEDIVREANHRLEAHQRIRGFDVWPDGALPRTEGTGKLKRSQVGEWVRTGRAPVTRPAHTAIEAAIARYAPGRTLTPSTTIAELGLTSLERVELMVEIERATGATLDEAAYASAQTLGDLQQLETAPVPVKSPEPLEFSSWNRRGWARLVRRVNLPLWILPAARVFARVRVTGVEHLRELEPPVIFAPNHQSHLDVPALLSALPPKWRYRLAPAMSKEFFDAHFHPERHSGMERLTNGLNYYLSSLVFNAFPLPQREAGARTALRYAGELAGEGWCIVIFPEGKITDTGEIASFQPGVGLLASRLHLPVVPVRLVGLDRVLHRTWKWPRRGSVEVRFGPALRLDGTDYAGHAAAVEAAVRAL